MIPMTTKQSLSLVAAFTLVFVAHWTPAIAEANGRVVRYERRVSGPYEIALGTIPDSPSVGNLHLTMTVADASSKATVIGAEITVTGDGPDPASTRIGPQAAQSNLTNPSFYDLNTSVDSEGIWMFMVSVRSELGDAQAEFPVEVRNPSPIAGILTLVVLIALLAILGFSLRAYLKEAVGGRGDASRRAKT